MYGNRLYTSESRRANARYDFYSHLTVYIIVNLMLAGLNWIITPTILWFVFPLAGWGAGLAVHGLTVFGPRLKQRARARVFTRPHGA